MALSKCARCGNAYNPDKSKSSLRLTWCSIMCEAAELGYHLRTFERIALPPLSEMVTRKEEARGLELVSV